MKASGNGKFSSYVTSTAFSLSLSKNMIDELAGVMIAGGESYNWFARGSGLYGIERRGLVTVEALMRADRDGDAPTLRHKVTASRAGKITFLLCVEAGLIQDNGNGDVSQAVAGIEMEFSKLEPEKTLETV